MTLFIHPSLAEHVEDVPAESIEPGDLVVSPFNGEFNRVKGVDSDASTVHIHIADSGRSCWCLTRGRRLWVTV